jgi:DNA gyrase subunit A
MDLAEIDEELLVVTQNGYGKKTSVRDYKIQTRGGKGVLTYNKAKFKKTGELIGASVVSDDDEIMLINSDSILIRIESSDISKLGRATQGVKIMKVGDDAKIIAMAKVAKEDDDDEGEDGPESDGGERGSDKGAEQFTLET